jgi:hypothetical protein
LRDILVHFQIYYDTDDKECQAYTQGVVLRLWPLAFVVLTGLSAQDAPQRSKASDYPAHGSLPGIEIGAEYLVHSIPAAKGYYFADDYLVVDVGVFPSTPEGISIRGGQFSLRINHGKFVLVPVSPGTVAAALKYPDWENQPRATAQAQTGSVTVSTPPTVGRFPGDPRQPIPMPRPAEDPPDPSGTQKEPPKTIDQSITNVALPDGPTTKPAKGCLFFQFTGKMKSIRSLDLIYDAGDGRPKATIPLF